MAVGWNVPLIGLLVGLLLGLTSLGGGSLLTPLLVIVVRMHPAAAVGTDLVCQAVTRAFSIPVHFRQRAIDGRLVALLAAGSIPGTLLTNLAVSRSKAPLLSDTVLLAALGVALILTAITILADPLIKRRRNRGLAAAASGQATSDTRPPSRRRDALTIAGGLFVGVSVGLTSVGAGSLVMALLVLGHSHLSGRRLVGTDLAHGFLLLPISAALALVGGRVDFAVVGGLLLGSVPGGLIGSRLAGWLPERPLRLTLAGMVFATGVRLLPIGVL
jgi:uncharacterized membrane protein YfcA